MEIKKNWKEELANQMANFEAKCIRLGMTLEALKREYYYKSLVEFIAGKNKDGGMYLEHLKPLYDEFGYEKVNRILTAIYNAEKGECADE